MVHHRNISTTDTCTFSTRTFYYIGEPRQAHRNEDTTYPDSTSLARPLGITLVLARALLVSGMIALAYLNSRLNMYMHSLMHVNNKPPTRHPKSRNGPGTANRKSESKTCRDIEKSAMPPKELRASRTRRPQLLSLAIRVDTNHTGSQKQQPLVITSGIGSNTTSA